MKVSKTMNTKHPSLKVRVPSKQFEPFTNSEKGDGEIIAKNINARDVTEEYVDGEIRLTSKNSQKPIQSVT